MLGNPLAPEEFVWTLGTLAGGALLVLLLARQSAASASRRRSGSGRRTPRNAAGRRAARTRRHGIAALRQWAVAGLSLLALALVFGLAMRASA